MKGQTWQKGLPPFSILMLLNGCSNCSFWVGTGRYVNGYFWGWRVRVKNCTKEPENGVKDVYLHPTNKKATMGGEDAASAWNDNKKGLLLTAPLWKPGAMRTPRLQDSWIIELCRMNALSWQGQTRLLARDRTGRDLKESAKRGSRTLTAGLRPTWSSKQSEFPGRMQNKQIVRDSQNFNTNCVLHSLSILENWTLV